MFSPSNTLSYSCRISFTLLTPPPPGHQFDYNKLAEIGNFKNAASARACFGPIKKKLLEGNTGGGASASPAAGGNGGAAADNKKAPRGKKREKETAPTAEGDDANGGGGDNGETPTKKARKTPVKKTKALPASVVDAPDEDLEDVV